MSELYRHTRSGSCSEALPRAAFFLISRWHVGTLADVTCSCVCLVAGLTVSTVRTRVLASRRGDLPWADPWFVQWGAGIWWACALWRSGSKKEDFKKKKKKKIKEEEEESMNKERNDSWLTTTAGNVVRVYMCIKVQKYLYRPRQAPPPQCHRSSRLPEFLDSRHVKVARLSSLRTGRLYTLGNTFGSPFC